MPDSYWHLLADKEHVSSHREKGMSAAGWGDSSAWGSQQRLGGGGTGPLGDDEHLLAVSALRHGVDDAF